MPEIIKKLRIKTYDTEFNQLTDRLVEPDVEYRKGPKDIAPGPIGLELMLENSDDIDRAIKYIQQLKGLVPLPVAVKKRGRKSKLDITPSSSDKLVDLLESIESPKELLEFLRDNGFVGMTLSYLADLGFPVAISDEDYVGYRFMVRMIKKAKNPLNNQYDPSFIIGFREKEESTVMVVFSKDDIIFKQDYHGNLKDKITVPAKYKVKFPPYIAQEERNKFRLEMGKLKDDPDLKPTRFYIRWVHDIAKVNPKEVVFPHIEQIPNPYE
jgi:hypothetical protein